MALILLLFYEKIMKKKMKKMIHFLILGMMGLNLMKLKQILVLSCIQNHIALYSIVSMIYVLRTLFLSYLVNTDPLIQILFKICLEQKFWKLLTENYRGVGSFQLKPGSNYASFMRNCPFSYSTFLLRNECSSDYFSSFPIIKAIFF